MTDYNRKFRELNLKISQVLKDNKIINKSIQQYNKKLNKIEEKSLKKLNDLEKSYLYVKDEFSKIVTIYNNIKKSEKTPLNIKEMNFIIQKVNFNLKNQRNESIEFIQSIFSNVERTISNIKDNVFNKKKEFSTECDDMKEIINNNINDSELILQNKSNKINQVLEEIKDNSGEELKNVNKLLEEESKNKEFSYNKLNKDLNYFENKTKEKISKSKKSRNEFEENILHLINEICIKIIQPH